MEAASREKTIKETARLFKLLADETRLRLLMILRRSTEMNVLELCQQLQLRQPSVSHHLAVLREAGLIEMRREGKHNYYRILPQRLGGLVASLAETSGPELGGRFFELLLMPRVSSID